ncbi:MAG TPA: ubiquinol-cytochrome C chaperone family protein [Phenylobacterium sp.]|uniref:ubiquinol-cytochrome C chaperone family protein n=1 Tax=Phenylobacterium sp. TaxID=1871053 RepID=UPI002B4A79A1|nr:ubiquinol-cytochrome C chaperone family protein [Phenylobacterium sp.]HKR90166.1 ubiquinol-cytochrome C chaperone family protein [Phenylobacterium sp.]
MLKRLFRPRPSHEIGRALYAAVVEQSRTPALYERLAAPDTVEGRFEIYTLHVVLLLDRLNQPGDEVKAASQGLFDTYVGALDHALREMGVGDLSVGKKMRRLGEAFFGRVKSYHGAFAALPDPQPLKDLLARTVYAEADASQVPALAAYVTAQREHLDAQPLEGFLQGRVDWRAP